MTLGVAEAESDAGTLSDITYQLVRDGGAAKSQLTTSPFYSLNGFDKKATGFHESLGKCGHAARRPRLSDAQRTDLEAPS